MLNKFYKKGAMFGLDARITLVIFAVMSIVVSVNIISILNEASTRKIMVESRAIASAVEQYHKDMNASLFDTLNTSLNADDKEKAAYKALYRNSNIIAPYSTKWDGPYIKVKYHNGKEQDLDKYYRLVRLSSSLSTTCNNTKANPCYVFLKFKDLDAEICQNFKDSTEVDGYSKVYEDTSGTDCHILIKLGLDY